uniref:Uncharacterized protein n=1 Tax=Chromera velia CCMP2878 TaxID=1169474 RepID=A0A0G4HFZ9_9ALVE|eukprot:Cvel_27224.t1-p1 / transcript=Cvel_27224.t1 / gene=Cvel_27224 / organism=Chromera_velia_CCMP2878 / gene_product=hypothetical protein / transcript_product=hypothetical protein / location=Cvel_scaffold3367:775-2259(+) / protein_length=495 / sequence_SO=supercontig / SO=protein_coding / is_pseudo=false
MLGLKYFFYSIALCVHVGEKRSHDEGQAVVSKVRKTDFVVAVLDAARDFVKQRGPTQSWTDIPLPKLPVGEGFQENGLDSDAFDERVTEDVRSLLRKCEKFTDMEEKSLDSNIHSSLCYVALLAVGLTGFGVFDSSPASSVGQGTRAKRPDGLLQVGDVDCVRIESKTKPADLNKACEEITTKMRKWSAAFYGDMPSILGIAAVGSGNFKAREIRRDGRQGWGLDGKYGTLSDVVPLVNAMIRVCAYARVRSDDEKWMSRRDSVSFHRDKDSPWIEKTSYTDVRIRHLCSFYRATENVKGLERAEKIPGTTHLKVKPFGCSRKPHPSEIVTALSDIVETVAEMHEKKWVHRDLRWPNVVLAVGKEGRRWTVIDCEYAAEVGTVWKSSLPPRDGFASEYRDPLQSNEADDAVVGPSRDYFLLGRMIQSVLAESGGQVTALDEGLGQGLGKIAEALCHCDKERVKESNKQRAEGFRNLTAFLTSAKANDTQASLIGR